jgi:formate-dependent nitrite reductase membrane component NrfD
MAQAKGRDFWQSPTLPLHMLVHSVMAGAAIFSLASLIFGQESWMQLIRTTAIIALVVNLFTIITELTITHPTTAAKVVVKMITKGRYKIVFWAVSIVIGNLVPLALFLSNQNDLITGLGGLCILVGILATEKIWVESPQRVPLA